MKHKNTTGFTLIEILVVVVIVSILSVLGVQMLSSGSVERNLQQHGRILQSSIEYSCDQATLQNIPYGIKFFQNGYLFAYFYNQQWLDVISVQSLNYKELTDGSILDLYIEGESIVLPEEADDTPQIMCDSSGQITAFELYISDATDTHHYLLKTLDFWNLDGQWKDAKES